MRLVPLFLLTLFLLGCSGGSSVTTPLPTGDQEVGRVSFSLPYTENSNEYVDVLVQNVSSLYGFSLKFQFDPNFVDLKGFEPHSVFGDDPSTRCESIENISESEKALLKDQNQKVGEIEVSISDPDNDEIEEPTVLGRLKYQSIGNIPDPNSPFMFIDDPDCMKFHNRYQERMNICPGDEKPQHQEQGGFCNGDTGKCDKDGCDGDGCGKDGGCKEKCKCGENCDGENCDCGCKDGCDGDCGNCDKCGKDDCDGNCGGGNCGDKCDKCGKDDCDGNCGGNPDKCDKCGKEDCDGNCGGSGGSGGGGGGNGGGSGGGGCGGGGNGGGGCGGGRG